MNTKQFIFLVALYCILHLAACYFQQRDRQRYYDTYDKFTLMFNTKGVAVYSVATYVFTFLCYIVWLIGGGVFAAAGFTYIWRWLA